MAYVYYHQRAWGNCEQLSASLPLLLSKKRLDIKVDQPEMIHLLEHWKKGQHAVVIL
jgi:hypothetical protein